jgi:hypothetical protein
MDHGGHGIDDLLEARTRTIASPPHATAGAGQQASIGGR